MAPPAARGAPSFVAGSGYRRDRLAEPARHQLFRLHADAEPRDSDRARHHGADVRHRWQRPRSVDRHLRRLRLLCDGDLAARHTLARRPGADRLRCALCRAWRSHLFAQFAFDRRHARHEFRVAGPRHPPSAEAWGKGARLALGDHGRQAAVHPLSDCRRRGHRGRWLFWADAYVLWRDPARVRRQCAGDRARRVVAAQSQNDPVRAGRRLWRFVGHGAGRHHHFGRRQYRQWLYAAFDCGRDPRRRRVRWRRRVAGRRRARRAHHGDGGVAAPDLHAYPAGLAGRRQWRDPHHRSCRSRRDHP